jgi:hypothetical protein
MGLPVETPSTHRDRTHLWVTFEREGRTVGRVVSSTGLVRWGSQVQGPPLETAARVLGSLLVALRLSRRFVSPKGPAVEFTYPVPDLDGREALFEPGETGARLRLRDGMVGVLRVGATQISVEDLGDWGLARGRAPVDSAHSADGGLDRVSGARHTFRVRPGPCGPRGSPFGPGAVPVSAGIAGP